MSVLIKESVKLLLVDDSSAINEMNKYFFEKSLPEISINISKNGQEALSYLENLEELEQPDLILLDLKMPVLDGLEFLKKIPSVRTETQLDKMKVILLTTSMNPEDKKKAKRYPFVVDYLVKPLSIVQVKGIVKKYLNET